MRHISYAETLFATDERVGALVMEYAAVLARAGSADTVTVPGRRGEGGVEPVEILVGPASQITTWSDDEPFGVEVGHVVDDLERRIRHATADSPTSELPVPPGAIDDFDDLA